MHVVCASSDYEQLAAICDRVLVFGRGRVWRELVGAEVTKERIVEQCYAAMAGRGGRGRRVTAASRGRAAAASQRAGWPTAPSATRCSSPGASSSSSASSGPTRS